MKDPADAVSLCAMQASTSPVPRFKIGICRGCGFVYSELEGEPALGVPAGTEWEALPEEWKCPRCDDPKTGFEVVLV
ncbi:rubredoxin [Paraburkholderia caribensis]